eukprot:106935-Chlamydomonas_euryale.AAC.3
MVPVLAAALMDVPRERVVFAPYNQAQAVAVAASAPLMRRTVCRLAMTVVAIIPYEAQGAYLSISFVLWSDHHYHCHGQPAQCASHKGRGRRNHHGPCLFIRRKNNALAGHSHQGGGSHSSAQLP